MQQQIFQVSSMIEAVSTRVDGTYKIVVGTPELSPEQAASLFALKGRQGWFVFKENAITPDEVPDEPVTEFRDEKSPSKRLKSVLYLYWRDHTSKNPDFNTFYSSWMERKIQEIKDKLN
jgi:hypothetical protein